MYQHENFHTNCLLYIQLAKNQWLSIILDLSMYEKLRFLDEKLVQGRTT